LKQRAWYSKAGGKECYNPYAVCAKNVGTSSKQCGENYSWEDIPDKELKAYAYLKKISVPRPYNRKAMIDRIVEHKRQEYE
jgi:hypothetical protein